MKDPNSIISTLVDETFADIITKNDINYTALITIIFDKLLLEYFKDGIKISEAKLLLNEHIDSICIKLNSLILDTLIPTYSREKISQHITSIWNKYSCHNCVLTKLNSDYQVPLIACTGCYNVVYCCEKCQIQDWPCHKCL